MLNSLARMRLGIILIRGHKGVWVLFLPQIPHGVVDLPMLGLVRPNVQQEISDRSVPLGHLPVIHGQIRYAELGVRPFRQLAGFDILDGLQRISTMFPVKKKNREDETYESVSQHSFLFQVANEAVAGAGRDEVGDEH
jgi:hypothetical protein